MSKKHDAPTPEPSPEPEKPLPAELSIEGVGASSDANPLEAKTLSGDIRDMILTHIRAMTVPWAMLNEDEQGDKIAAATMAGQDLVRQCLQVIAKNKLPSIAVAVGAYKIDKTLEVKITANPSVANITLLAEHGHGGAMLILAEASDYFGERAPAKPAKNQPSLPLDPPVDND